MLKTAGRYTKILNYILVVLVFALFILQLMPFWESTAVVNKEEVPADVSIQGYTWWPLDVKSGGPNLTKTFEGRFGKDWEIVDIVLMPVIVVFACIMTFFFGIKKPTRLWMNIIYLLCGISGVVGYLTIPVYQDNGIWIVHLIVCFLMIAVSIANVVMRPWDKIVRYMKTGE